MAVANITVAYVNPPKEGGKKGSVKTESGDIYGVWADKLHLYAKGGKYTVEYEEQAYQGKQYRTIKRIIQSAQPTASGSGGGDEEKATKIFVTAVLGKVYEGTGGIPDEDTIYNQALALRAAWERAFAAKLGPSPAQAPILQQEELNDEIPF